MEKIKNIMQGCNELTKEQLLMMQGHEEKLSIADYMVCEAVEDSRKAGEELRAASGHKLKGLKYKMGMLVGGIGAVVGGIFGMGAGAAVGGVGGAVVGTKVGGKIDRSAKKKYKALEFEGVSGGV